MFTKDREFYKMFVRLCLTLMVEQAVILSVNLADNVMIGNYSETALSGVAAVNQIQFVLQQVIYAVSNGIIVLSSQYWGQQRMEPIRHLSSAGARVGLGIAMGFFFLVSLFPQQTLGIFTTDPAIMEEGVKYLQIIRFTYPVFALTTVLLGAMRSVENVQIALIVSTISLVINCCINYVLIGGHFDAPALGVRGAAIGTLTARIVECIIVILFVTRKEKRLRLKPQDFLHTDKLLFRDFVRVSTPIIISGALWGLSNALQTVILGHMANNAIAAYSISSTIFLLLKVTSLGACTAASIIVGKVIGSGDLRKLKEYVRTLQALFVCIGIALSIALFLIRVPLLSVYNISDDTYALANAFMLIQTVTICTMSYQYPTNGGIIRGGGDTNFIMIVDFVSIWCIVLPLSCLAAFVWKLSPVIVVMLLNSDQVFKCVPAFLRVNHYKWIKSLTREASDPKPES